MKKHIYSVFILLCGMYTMTSCQKNDEMMVSSEASMIGTWTVILDGDLVTNNPEAQLPVVSFDLMMAPSLRLNYYLGENNKIAEIPQPSVLSVQVDNANSARKAEETLESSESRELVINPDSEVDFVEMYLELKEDKTAVAIDANGSYSGTWSVNERELVLNIGDLTQIFEILSLTHDKATLYSTFDDLDQATPTSAEILTTLKR